MIFGALEAGGTKMVLSTGNENYELIERIEIPTKDPDSTIAEMNKWFSTKNIKALGIGSFGPVELDMSSNRYGYITETPKPGWRNTPLLPLMKKYLKVPVLIDTDVNAAALAESMLGCAKGLDSCIYITIGTGIGGGIVINGKLIHGLMHPEVGHIMLHPEENDPTPNGFCPYHIACLEGLAAGPAIEKRWGISAKLLPPDHPAWDLEARYLAQMCVNALCFISPKKIVLGGGVMHQKQLLSLVQKYTLEKLNGYINKLNAEVKIEELITSPGLGVNSGAVGALILAVQAYNNMTVSC